MSEADLPDLMSIQAPSQETSPKKPLVSLILFTYKQPHFVRAAIKGALSQTYSPLEIIISDDASPDHTFEVIQEAVAGYQGPHRIVLNRNPENMGIGAHVHYAVSLAKGDWLVLAAGDDISLPGRIALQMEAAARYPKAHAIGGNYLLVDAEGKPCEVTVTPAPVGFYDRRKTFQIEARFRTGCTFAYRRECWDLFPPVAKGLVAEDLVFCIRAGLLGGVLILPDQLIHYRMHGNNAALTVAPNTFQLPEDDPYVRQFERDIKALGEKGLLSASETRECIADVYRYRRYYYYRELSGQSLKDLIRCNLCLHVWKDRNLLPSKIRSIVPQILRKLLRR